jgi:hypothetical protein
MRTVRIYKSETCKPCKDLAAELTTVNDKFIDYVDIHDVVEELRGVPTIIYLDEGIEKDKDLGYSPYTAKKIINWIYNK